MPLILYPYFYYYDCSKRHITRALAAFSKPCFRSDIINIYIQVLPDDKEVIEHLLADIEEGC